MPQLALLSAPTPPDVSGIDLRCADVAEVVAGTVGARMVHADPPWIYDNAAAQGNAADQYDLLTIEQIAAHVDAAYDAAGDDAYLALWTTWPKLGEWMAAAMASRWTLKTGGAWGKIDRLGVGYHWRGDSEPVLLYVKGNPRPLDRAVSNLHVSEREAHSEKPAPFLRRMLAAFTSPGDLVLDLYAGLAPMARACAAEGRRYVGAEIDPGRHRQARDRLAMFLAREAQ